VAGFKLRSTFKFQVSSCALDLYHERSMHSICKLLTLVLAFVLLPCSRASSPMTIHLWPGTPPGNKGSVGPEHDTTKPEDRKVAGKPVIRLTDVANPTLTIFRPSSGRNTGAAVLVCPGGAYRILAMDLEGSEICRWLNSISVTAGLLKYRVPRQEADDAHALPLQDAQRAMSLMRHRASGWGIDPHRIGVMGFSAGGHLSASLCNNFSQHNYPQVDSADSESCRPDFALLIYPAYLLAGKDSHDLAPEMKITSNTPPSFLVMTMDDPLRPDGAAQYALALHNGKVSAELHLFPEGGHGYGLRPDPKLPVTAWPKLAADWLRGQGFVGRKP
jgi:acetyl esterase/lipase